MATTKTRRRTNATTTARTRSKKGRAVIKIIVGFGVVTFCAMMLFALSLKEIAKRNQALRVTGNNKQSPFDGERAIADLKRIVDLGPRPPGSPEAAKVRAIIHQELDKVGIPVSEHPFTAQTPIGPVEMVNVVGEIAGTKPGVIILSNHYDTKYLPKIRFVGANDGGSTTAWMIEMARALGPKREGFTVWLVWFDGEEAYETWSAKDSLYGSREFVRMLQLNHDLDKIKALINVDMIGDCFLGIAHDREAPPQLDTPIWLQAGSLGHGGHFLEYSLAIEDDHVPFRIAGIPSIDLIDFQYGGSALEHRANWHTANDTMDHVCGQSLQVVGDVLYHALPSVEQMLNTQPRP